MMILIDTNVFSELTKADPEPLVSDWLFARRKQTLLSSIVIAELDIGIRTTKGAGKRALLNDWFDRLIASHAGRIIDFNMADARKWAEYGAKLLIAEQRAGSRAMDTLLAAQALSRGVPFATRNVRHFEGIGLEVIDPWEG